jgi:hypothetical protein
LSRLIVDFIATHGALPEEDAFERFVAQEPIASWVKGDSHRRERVEREFRFAWRQQRPSSPRTVEVRTPAADAGPPRQLSLLCPACMKLDVWSRGDLVECYSCGRVYDDLLALVPIRRIGPFAFVFGTGWRGVATAAGLTLLLVAVYGAFRWT